MNYPYLNTKVYMAMFPNIIEVNIREINKCLQKL